MELLVVNAGSSSLKFALFDETAREEQASCLLEWMATPAAGESAKGKLRLKSLRHGRMEKDIVAVDHAEGLDAILVSMRDLGFHIDRERAAVGHRIVHGGSEFTGATAVDDHVLAAIQSNSTLAPLHNPPALATLQAARLRLPGAFHVACFDTAFFASLPPRSFLFPVPYLWYEEWGVRRYGFHGLSHSYSSLRAAELLGRDPATLKTVVCHLGSGCSAASVDRGKAAATTMGFTPLDGLMMGTRPGAVDPGVLIHVLKTQRLSIDELDLSLTRNSGILGISGTSSDYRLVKASAEKGDERARLALDMFHDRVRGVIASLAAGIGGLDVLVFTAGVGENSAFARSAICDGLDFMGIVLDSEKNESSRPDCDVSAAHSKVRVLSVAAREEQMIARETRRLYLERSPISRATSNTEPPPGERPA